MPHPAEILNVERLVDAHLSTKLDHLARGDAPTGAEFRHERVARQGVDHQEDQHAHNPDNKHRAEHAMDDVSTHDVCLACDGLGPQIAALLGLDATACTAEDMRYAVGIL